MTIIHLTPSYKPAFVYGGPIYSVSALCEAQVALGHKVTVFCTNANGKENLSVPLNEPQWINGVCVNYFPRITGDHTHVSLKMWSCLFKEAKEYDIVHLHSWWSILMMGCAWILKFKGVPFILSPRGMFSFYSFNHNIHPIKKKVFFEWLSKPVLKNQTFHATAISEQKEIISLFGENAKVFTLPNLLQFPDISLGDIQNSSNENASITTSPLKILFISRIDKKKGIEILLKSIELLNNKGVFIELTIIGSGTDNYINNLKELVSSLNITSNVLWKGSVEWRAKFEDILATDILILPSYNENFANIILETLYAGRPVILTKYVGLSDYVEDNNMGWVIDTKPDDIVTAVKYYLKEKHIWKQKALWMNQQIEKDFNQQYLAEQYITCYREGKRG